MEDDLFYTEVWPFIFNGHSYFSKGHIRHGYWALDNDCTYARYKKQTIALD